VKLLGSNYVSAQKQQRSIFFIVCYVYAAVLCIAASVGLFVLLGRQEPLYRANVRLVVNNSINQEYIASTDLSVSQKLVDTYVTVIKSDTVLEKVQESGNFTYSPARLRSMITAQQVEATEIFTVNVSSPDPLVAAEVANTIAMVAPGECAKIVTGSSAKVLDYAKMPTAPYTPNYTKNALVGALVGFVIAIVYLTIRYLMDVHINDAEDLERMFDYPVLGQIPDIMQVRNRTRGAYAKYAEEAEENEKNDKGKLKS